MTRRPVVTDVPLRTRSGRQVFSSGANDEKARSKLDLVLRLRPEGSLNRSSHDLSRKYVRSPELEYLACNGAQMSRPRAATAGVRKSPARICCTTSLRVLVAGSGSGL